MERRWTLSATVVAGLLLLAACGPGDTDGRVAELEAELASAQDEIAELRATNEELEAELAARDESPEDDPDDGEGEPSGFEPTGEEPASLRSPEGLSEQLRLLFGWGPDFPDEWEPGTTDWEPFELPDEVAEATYDELGLLGVAMLEAFDGPMLGLDTWESTVRALIDDDDPDQGYVAVLSWGYADDAVRGRDVRVTVTRDGDVWQPGGAEVRHHCLRGVTDDNLCT